MQTENTLVDKIRNLAKAQLTVREIAATLGMEISEVRKFSDVIEHARTMGQAEIKHALFVKAVTGGEDQFASADYIFTNVVPGLNNEDMLEEMNSEESVMFYDDDTLEVDVNVRKDDIDVEVKPIKKGKKNVINKKS